MDGWEPPNKLDNFWIHAWIQKRIKGYEITITPQAVTVTLTQYGSEQEESFSTIGAAFDYMESLRLTSYKVPRKVQRKLSEEIIKQLKQVNFQEARDLLKSKLEKQLGYFSDLEAYINQPEIPR